MRGVARGELPAGVDRILTMQELDERARDYQVLPPEYGCSTEYGIGWLVIIQLPSFFGYDTIQLVPYGTIVQL
jgi:hypothetical protein